MVAREGTIWAEGVGVEPVAVAIEAILGEIFVPGDFKGGAMLFGLLPGERLDADELDVAGVVVVAAGVMAEFVQEEERGLIVAIVDGLRGRKLEALTAFEFKFWVDLLDFID